MPQIPICKFCGDFHPTYYCPVRNKIPIHLFTYHRLNIRKRGSRKDTDGTYKSPCVLCGRPFQVGQLEVVQAIRKTQLIDGEPQLRVMRFRRAHYECFLKEVLKKRRQFLQLRLDRLLEQQGKRAMRDRERYQRKKEVVNAPSSRC